MEIRKALQKIENYLTVVSNLNKTILSEGTMSRDELLLMKKYLYTSIDRIEDIERSLVISQKEENSFTPSETIVETFIPKKEKEIVQVEQQSNVEELEATLSNVEEKESSELQQDIIAEAMDNQEPFLAVENFPEMPLMENETVEQTVEISETIEITPLVGSIITEDDAVNKTEESVEEKTEALPFVESIITEDYSINKLVQETVAENVTFVESIITEDYALNEYKENTLVNETQTVSSIITEDYAVNKMEEPVVMSLVEEAQEDTVSNIPLAEKLTTEVETVMSRFQEQKPLTLAEELAGKKKEESLLFEKFEQKSQPKLFELFEDDKEEVKETFTAFSSFVPESTGNAFGNNAVLVVEKEVETMVEELTPSSLNEIFKPQTILENVNTTVHKTLSESIALNDKFIFVRELFGNQFAEYEKGLKQIDALSSFSAAENFCKDNLWNKFNWNNKTTAVERFMDLLQKRFN
ncbi:MAG: hypothetical protein U0T77_08900 [Chitinophagales bacterium]